MKCDIPNIIAHRGASYYAPENTLEAIKVAHKMGATWVELDVKLTKDNVLVIFHDDDLLRIAKNPSYIKDLNFNELKEIYPDIPTLSEVFSMLDKLSMGFNLEIKPCEGREIDTTNGIIDFINTHWRRARDILISSFSQDALYRARELDEDINIGLLFEEALPANWQKQVSDLKPASIHIDTLIAESLEFQRLLTLNTPIFVYTINDKNKAQELFKRGASGIFTDKPDLLNLK